MKQALIIFVRNPVLGRVKTRLAETAGAQRALDIYCQLLNHTRQITRDLHCDKFVFYADEPGGPDIWDKSVYCKELQQGSGLGERMEHAFAGLFAKGYEAVVIIGSDCMELTPAVIIQAFTALAEQDVVLGPTADGGYYLMGLTRMHSRLFHNMPWSTGAVLEKTLERCKEAGLQVSLCPLLHDIDDEAGWNRYQTLAAT